MKKSKFFNETRNGLTFICSAFLTLLSIFLSSTFDVSFLPVLASWFSVFSVVFCLLYLVSLIANTKRIKKGVLNEKN